MRYLIIGMFLGLFIAHVGTAHSATLILNDGSRVGIADDEQVFISKFDLYRKQGDEVNGITYTPADPVLLDPEVVVVPPKPVEPSCLLNGKDDPSLCPIGSVAYCTHYFDQPDLQLTFEYIAAQKRCDTNTDGVYNYCDDYVPFENGYTFADQWWDRMCNIIGNRDFNPTRNRRTDGDG